MATSRAPRDTPEQFPDGEHRGRDRRVLRVQAPWALDEEPRAEHVFDGRTEEQSPLQQHRGLLEVDSSSWLLV
ncbi:hypothetical protein ACFQL1_19220 [Halomicroarcula sp. GCM10025709]|uniref:hypothetical protein n=1 Tax=Halomicroarcula sp. GCM10025709 TaxID=3252669 RepID=UPI0036153508